jgi:coenzyme PQQ precursor peptide PqqA
MMIPLRGARRLGRGWACRTGVVRFPSQPEKLVMKWETPQAIDFRFGMEITMYIAHR